MTYDYEFFEYLSVAVYESLVPGWVVCVELAPPQHHLQNLCTGDVDLNRLRKFFGSKITYHIFDEDRFFENAALHKNVDAIGALKDEVSSDHP